MYQTYRMSPLTYVAVSKYDTSNNSTNMTIEIMLLRSLHFRKRKQGQFSK
jgi:hypothetical protein